MVADSNGDTLLQWDARHPLVAVLKHRSPRSSEGSMAQNTERLLFFRKQLSVAFTKRSAVIRETRIIAPPGPKFTGCVSCVIPHVQCIGGDIRHSKYARRNLTICGRGIQHRDLIERRSKSEKRAFRKE